MELEIVFSKVLVLFVFIVAGWALAKGGLVKAEHGRILSGIEVYVFLPCVSFNSFSQNCTLDYLGQKYPLIFVSLGILLVLWALSHFAAKLFTKEAYERTVYEYSLLMPNYGFMGYALCKSLYGEMGLLDMMIFTLPMAVYVASVGFLSLTRRTGKDFKPIRLLTPSMIGILLGCLVGLPGIKLPSVITDVSQSAANCMAPVAMLLTGITISQFDLKELFKDKRSYLITAVRLIAVPLVICGALNLIGLGKFIPTALAAYAMPCGLNTVVYPKLVGENCRIGASLALISAIASLITIPICLTFLT